MHGLEGMSGVTIATTPFRARIRPEMTVKEMVDDAYAREIRQLPYEQVGLSAISRLGDDAAAACRCNCLIVMQPDALVKSRILSDVTDAQGLQNYSTFGTYALTLVCNQASGSVRVQAVYDDSVVSPSQMSQIFDQFAHILWQVTAAPDSCVAELMTASPKDIAVLTAWNRTAPDNAGTCVHTLIDRQCRGQPEAAAVCSASGTLSYGELEHVSSQLDVHLTNMHVGPEQFVPLCFEKSQWTTVAMLAVIKAGAAFVLLDPSYPSPRLQEICTVVRLNVILCSQQHAAKAQHLGSVVVPVDGEDGRDWRVTSLTNYDPLCSPATHYMLSSRPDRPGSRRTL
jgi:non-ribosomal peptide synthetase component F